ncbi:Ribosome biogenesis protein BOP1 [Portunus trituberculatus]|uniref:Ribosome biogenesis protein BOP1 n=1 Tax=Portunus trituberculatus TaxID=210409 RepID=A0A5B7HNU8_PORTR|nr:Ribosome biogenesis protein BOP1 [Portunus trituberculatus]
MRVKAESKDLIPVLPKPQDLRPFPSMMGHIFKGHRSIIRSISVHPQGKYLASGSDDHTVKSELLLPLALCRLFLSVHVSDEVCLGVFRVCGCCY